ncbi:DUF2510 domain-containing protein [uncultured Actinomyces sp.]|uniref:DUF2510 domain-containing protein n=1 Tax=uncultured Actinomyces sp. TaxID=249061 RepID=UPI0028EA25D0|nr:DUF2510 domain-containing protein [uncultured Actinomyces sp.]
MTTPMPGWYPDPRGRPRQCWWDGARWTEQYRHTSGVGAPIPGPPAAIATSRRAAHEAPAPIPAPPIAATASSPRPRAEGATQPPIPQPPAPRKLTRLPVVLMVLSLFFAVSAIIAAQTYSTLGTQHQRAEQEVADAQTYLQKVKELFR